jgi:hypothetical protein
MDLGETLALKVRRDYTFIHPDVLDQKCSVDGATLKLNNKVNREQYRVFIIPGSRAIHWSNLEKVKRFYDQGGIVVATTRLPEGSAEFGKDTQVRETVAALFGSNSPSGGPTVTASPAQSTFRKRTNANGGKTYFVARPTPAALRGALDDALSDWDVRFEQDPRLTGGNLSYIHKVIEGREVYFFGNSSDTPVKTAVRLRGQLRLERWDPHTGKIEPQPSEIQDGTTRVPLDLAPVRSMFLVSIYHR